MTKLLFFCMFILPLSARSNISFEKWKEVVVKRAAKRGIPISFSTVQLKNVKYSSQVVEREKKPITSNRKINYQKWMKKWLRENPSRIDMAKELLLKHHKLLEEVEKKYGVDKEIIISLWGVESLFGEIVGDYDLITVLASLAYNSRRKSFFEIQLFAAFRLLYKKHVERDKLKGSWAGATGQLQFMPSNFNVFARDFDGDGKKDIWNNYGDIFASIAFYLKKNGWKKGRKVGVFTNQKSKKGTVVVPFENSPYILPGPNYKVITRWNNSSLFAAFNITLLNHLY